jgi:hypothetical protein
MAASETQPHHKRPAAVFIVIIPRLLKEMVLERLGGTMLRCGVFLLILSATVATGQDSEHSILSYKQFPAIKHQNPYILEFKTASGRLLFYGAEHTVDCKNPQVAYIENRWAAFHPTVAYNEGGNPPTFEDVEEIRMRQRRRN